jgi:hypothetical protein
MPIAASDIQFRLSGGAANVDPNLSLGGIISTAGGGAIADNVANNLWDDVTGDEAAAGDTEYRGIYIKNNHGSLTLQGAVIWFDGTAGSAPSSASRNFDMAIAAEAVSVSMATIANESAVPATVSFTRPTTKAGGLQLNSTTGLIAAAYRGVWIKRAIIAAAAAANDTVSIRVEGDTLP